VSIDNIVYQSSIGLYGDLGSARETVKRLFANDPSFMEFALRGPTISEFTRSLFNDVAREIEGE
jgi:hypothetical protein